MPGTPLPLDSTWQDIAHAINVAQRRCRAGVARDSLQLAKRAAGQAQRALEIARVLGRDIRELRLSAHLWEPGVPGDLQTVVVLRVDGITVERCQPRLENGVLWLTVREQP